MHTQGLIIGIAGPTASGKTTVATFLAKQHGAFRTKYSDVLIEHAKGMRNPPPLDKRNLQELSTKLRTEYGESYLTDALRKRLQYVPNKVVVIEGNRRMVDMEFLVSLASEQGKTLILLYIDADPAARWSRFNRRLRAEKKPPVLRTAFDLLEEDECEAELPLVRDYVVKHGTVVNTTFLTTEEVAERISTIFPLQNAA